MAKPMSDWSLVLATRLINANNKNRFVSVVTRGERGYGKSMYNLKVIAMMLHVLYNYSEKEAWEKALDYIIFDPYEYMRRIEHNYDNDIIDPVWCLDDAGVYFTGMLFFRNPHLYDLISGSFDTIRTVTNAVLITCPFKDKLMNGLKQYDDREVTIYIDTSKENGHGVYGRKAVCIKWYRLPSGRKEWYKDFEDRFSCYIPTWIYNRYLEKRRYYNKEISKRWRKRIDELDAKN